MTRLLLDHPWPLDATLNARTDGFQVLLKFADLLRRQSLPFESIVPFVEQQEYYDAIQQLTGRTSAAAAVRRFSRHFIRYSDCIIRAIPVPEPNPALNDCWKRALRDELDHPENWRNPQIVFPEKRRTVWPDTAEVTIQCEDREETDFRVLASLENFESHQFAVADLDPWCHLEQLCSPQPGAKNNKPCRLPRPPILDQAPVEQLSERLEEARRQGWHVNEKYYYIPPADCFPEQITKLKWRSGYAFPREKVPGWKGPCPIDYNGVTWRWDRKERHWDVQLSPYISINYDGIKL